MMDELYREELYKELSTFARANRKALRSAEQWLDEFDRGDFMAAWKTAKNEVPTVDWWRKIVYIAWWATDKKLYECKFEFIEKADLRKWCEEGQVYFSCDLMSSGHTATNEYSNLYLIRSALDEGKRATSGVKMEWQDDAPDFMFLKEAVNKLTERKISLSTMSKKLKPNGPIRYMKKSQRCKVHIGDFTRYINEQENKGNFFTEEIFEKYFKEANETKAKIRQQKQT